MAGKYEQWDSLSSKYKQHNWPVNMSSVTTGPEYVSTIGDQ